MGKKAANKIRAGLEDALAFASGDKSRAIVHEVPRSNAPAFDPLNATPEEEADMLAGYLAAGPDGPGFRPDPVSMAYEHGWRMRRNDLAGLVDDDQRELARRMLAKA